MKKFISCILAGAMLCSSAVAFADEKEVVIDTEVPVFRDLVDGSSYLEKKKIEIADLSKVDYIVMRVGGGTVDFAGRTFSGYTKVKEGTGLECIEYTEIETVTEAGSYMVYATDAYNHDIAVRFEITNPVTSHPGGGGGGGGGGAATTINPPYANGDPNNTEGELIAGEKITLDSDTGNTKIYYTTDGKKPTSESQLYNDADGIVLTEGQTLKAVAAKGSLLSAISEWKCVAPISDEPSQSGGSIVGNVLEAEEHIVYMSGYPDGNFGPDNNMTRAEVATMFARLMKEKMDPDAVYKPSFKDVTPDAWYYNYVGYIEKFGVISGYEDGSFKPLNAITRAEFVTMASRFATMTKDFECIFADVKPEYWAYDYIAFAAGNGWINGYEDNTFRADNTISRAEVVTIVNNMLARSADKAFVDANKSSLKFFADVKEGHWAYYNIVEATNEHKYEVTDKIEKWNQ